MRLNVERVRFKIQAVVGEVEATSNTPYSLQVIGWTLFDKSFSFFQWAVPCQFCPLIFGERRHGQPKEKSR